MILPFKSDRSRKQNEDERAEWRCHQHRYSSNMDRDRIATDSVEMKHKTNKHDQIFCVFF